jgi:hypothetical protein
MANRTDWRSFGDIVKCEARRSRVPPPLGEGVASCLKPHSLAQGGASLDYDSYSTHITMPDGEDLGATASMSCCIGIQAGPFFPEMGPLLEDMVMNRVALIL